VAILNFSQALHTPRGWGVGTNLNPNPTNPKINPKPNPIDHTNPSLLNIG